MIEPRPSSWSTGLFDCFTDMPSCVVGYFLPCVLYGDNASALKGKTFGGSCCAFYGLTCVNNGLFLLFQSALRTHPIALMNGWFPIMAGFPIFSFLQLLVMPALTLDNRKRIKEAYNIQEEACGGRSYLIHMFCLSCALCQEARELKIRGHSHSNPLSGKMTDYKPPTIITEAPVQVHSMGIPLTKQSLAQKEEKEEEVEDMSETTALLNPIQTYKI